MAKRKSFKIKKVEIEKPNWWDMLFTPGTAMTTLNCCPISMVTAATTIEIEENFSTTATTTIKTRKRG